MTKIVVVATEDLEEVRDYLGDIKERTEDFRHVFRRMRDDLEDQWKKNFLTTGSLVGRWAPFEKE